MHQVAVAALAVFLNRLSGHWCCPYGLGFLAGGKNIGVAHTVAGLKKVFPEEVILRHVAIVTGGDAGVAAVFPGSELGNHHVAIDAGFGIVGEVGNRPGNPQGCQDKPHQNAQENENRQAPLGRRDQKTEKSGEMCEHEKICFIYFTAIASGNV